MSTNELLNDFIIDQCCVGSHLWDASADLYNAYLDYIDVLSNSEFGLPEDVAVLKNPKAFALELRLLLKEGHIKVKFTRTAEQRRIQGLCLKKNASSRDDELTPQRQVRKISTQNLHDLVARCRHILWGEEGVGWKSEKERDLGMLQQIVAVFEDYDQKPKTVSQG